MGFGQRHYVPVLRLKSGEATALARLDATTRSRVTPFLEIPNVAWDFEKERPKESLEMHLPKMVDRLGEAWAAQEAFVDLLHIPSGDRALPGGEHVVSNFFTHAREKSLSLVPVTGPDRDTAYQSAVREVAALDRGGICLRVRRDDFLGRDLTGLDDLLADLGVAPEQTDLVLDLGAIVEGAPRYLSTALEEALRRLPRIRNWRSLILTATSFPQYLTELDHGIDEVPRHDWTIWTALAPDLPRAPTFGDYAVANPNIEELDPRTMKMSASIRYTDERRWVIARGRNIQQYGAEQYRDLSRRIVRSDVFKGATFSAGDRYMKECADGTGRVGNATTWRWVGTNHHLAFVVHQLANRA